MKKSIICAAAILAAGAISCNMAFSYASGSTAFPPITALAAEAATGNLIVNISGVRHFLVLRSQSREMETPIPL